MTLDSETLTETDSEVVKETITQPSLFDLGEFTSQKEEVKHDPIYTNDRIAAEAFKYFRKTGFPYRKLELHVAMQEINKLSQLEGDALLHSSLGYSVADTYHKHRFHASAEGMKSPTDSFNDDPKLKHAIEWQLQEGGAIPAGYFSLLSLTHGTQACSNFRPGFALKYYRQYCQKGATVLDTSTGYGGRLVGFIASGLEGRYIGIDPNKLTYQANLTMAQDLGFAGNVELYLSPAEDLDISLVKDRCDFSFTSPPYFSKEHYAEDDTQSWVRYKEPTAWFEGFLVPMMKLQYNALKNTCFSVVNIADVKIGSKNIPLTEYIRKAAEIAGFVFIKEENYILNIQLGVSKEVHTEPVFVFQKVEI